jgi:hypothetical protein
MRNGNTDAEILNKRQADAKIPTRDAPFFTSKTDCLCYRLSFFPPLPSHLTTDLSLFYLTLFLIAFSLDFHHVRTHQK